MNKRKNRRSVGGHSTAAERETRRGYAHVSIGDSKSELLKTQVPIYRADGVVIGEVRGDTYFKKIHTAHLLTTPRGIASDVDALRQAEQAGAKFFCAYHVEGRKEYRAPIARFWARGIKLNRGFGEQVALVLADFNCDDNTPTPTTPKPSQPSLFNLARLLG